MKKLILSIIALTFFPLFSFAASTSTLSDFWYGFATTTADTVGTNWPFFAMVFMAALVIMLLGGLVVAFTRPWKHFAGRGWKGRAYKKY